MTGFQYFRRLLGGDSEPGSQLWFRPLRTLRCCVLGIQTKRTAANYYSLNVARIFAVDVVTVDFYCFTKSAGKNSYWKDSEPYFPGFLLNRVSFTGTYGRRDVYLITS